MYLAILRNEGVGCDVLPRLRDAVVRWIGDGSMTISGFEFNEANRQCSVQSWYVQLALVQIMDKGTPTCRCAG